MRPKMFPLTIFVSIVGICAIIWWFGFVKTWCNDRIIRQFPSPSGSWTITLFAQDCGLEEEHVGLAISKTNSNYDRRECHLVWCSGCDTEDVSIQWTGDDKAKVEWPGCAPWNLEFLAKSKEGPEVEYGNFANNKTTLEGRWQKTGEPTTCIFFGAYSSYSANATVRIKGRVYKQTWGASGSRMFIGAKQYRYALAGDDLELISEVNGNREHYRRQ